MDRLTHSHSLKIYLKNWNSKPFFSSLSAFNQPWGKNLMQNISVKVIKMFQFYFTAIIKATFLFWQYGKSLITFLTAWVASYH